MKWAYRIVAKSNRKERWAVEITSKIIKDPLGQDGFWGVQQSEGGVRVFMIGEETHMLQNYKLNPDGKISPWRGKY